VIFLIAPIRSLFPLLSFWIQPVSAARQEENVSSYTLGVGADL
jgi:hypothetical protein